MPHVPSLLDVLFIFLIFLLFFGSGRLSGLGKGIGDGIRNFKKGLHSENPPPPSPPPQGPDNQQPKS
jgi:sec-independent protein translocase protein TatA